MALTQPEHLILVRWMGLETQWKTSWKHGRAWNPCLKRFQTRMQIFLICILISKATKTRGDKQLYLIIYFTKQTFKPKLFTADVECNGTLLKEPKTEKAILLPNFFSLNDGDLVFWFTFNLAVHFRPKMALTLALPRCKNLWNSPVT